MKKGIMVLLTLLLLVASAVSVSAATTGTDLEVVCASGDTLAEDAAKTQCDFLGDPDENVVLAQRRCTRIGKSCINRQYNITQEDITACEERVIELCGGLNDQEPQLRDTKAVAKEPKAIKPEPVLVPEEVPEPVEVEVEVPVPEPEPKMGFFVWLTGTAGGWVTILVVLLVLWYLLSGKDKKGGKKK